MCGLFGTILKNKDEDELRSARQARDTLTHRGPDQSGEWVCDNVYMGHRRLSILDLSDAGRQPMVTEDEKIGISVNGEIYNFQSLKSELKTAGYTFKSKSDSEVALHGYRHWGIEGLAERLDGMYAIIIYDQMAKIIHTIRDRVGIKPLYYYYNNTEFAWASELKALQYWLPAEKKIIDQTALYDFLTYRYIPAPKSLYNNIYKLPPAHILSFYVPEGRVKLKKYWELHVSERVTDNDETLSKELKSLIEESVKAQMISDVPIGFLLSGGIDSSVITIEGAKISSDPQSYSIGFKDDQRDESPYAQEISKLAGTQHHRHVFEHEEMNDFAELIKQWFDEPFGDTSAIPTRRVCQFAREDLTVALSGDGGDELFGGYVWYDLFHRLRKIQHFVPIGSKVGFKIPRSWPKHRILTLLSIRDPLEQYAYLRGGMLESDLREWKKKLNISDDYDRLWAYRLHHNPALGRRKSAQIMDFHTYLPDDILTKVDRTSMSVALECRPPFLSRNLIEFCFSLPEKFLYKDNMLKGCMKYTYKNIIPDHILYRRKQGFSVPFKKWRKDTERAGNLQEFLLQNFL